MIQYVVHFFHLADQLRISRERKDFAQNFPAAKKTAIWQPEWCFEIGLAR